MVVISKSWMHEKHSEFLARSLYRLASAAHILIPFSTKGGQKQQVRGPKYEGVN